MGDIINLMDEPVQIFRSNIINLKLLLSYKLLLESDKKRVQNYLKDLGYRKLSEREIARKKGGAIPESYSDELEKYELEEEIFRSRLVSMGDGVSFSEDFDKYSVFNDPTKLEYLSDEDPTEQYEIPDWKINENIDKEKELVSTSDFEKEREYPPTDVSSENVMSSGFGEFFDELTWEKKIEKRKKIDEVRKEKKFQKWVKRNTVEHSRRNPTVIQLRDDVFHRTDTWVKEGTPGITGYHPELGRMRTYYLDAHQSEGRKEITEGTRQHKWGGKVRDFKGFSNIVIKDSPMQRQNLNRLKMRRAREKRIRTKELLKIKKIQERLRTENLSEIKAARLGDKIKIIRQGILKPPRGK